MARYCEAMSKENIEIVHQVFDAFSRGDFDGVLRLCDENIVITQPRELLDAPASQQHGHAGVLEAFAIWPEQWEDYRVESVEVLADPADLVVVASRQSGRGRQSGLEVTMEFTFLFTVQGAKITRWRLFVDRVEALEAAGL